MIQGLGKVQGKSKRRAGYHAAQCIALLDMIFRLKFFKRKKVHLLSNADRISAAECTRLHRTSFVASEQPLFEPNPVDYAVWGALQQMALRPVAYNVRLDVNTYN